MTARVVRSESTDPHLNLALEDALLDRIEPGSRTLFLCRNRDSVIVGRHQNPWIECDLFAMRSDGVLLARRQSGGGAVFHDTGNTNYSFLAAKAEYDQDAGFQIVLHALADLGIRAERTERNDIVHGGRKFSGSAFRHRRGRSFHHGTLLLSADLDRLVRYLRAPARRITAKGTASIRSRVVNLSELDGRISHDAVCDAIARRFLERYHGRHARPGVTGEPDPAGSPGASPAARRDVGGRPPMEIFEEGRAWEEVHQAARELRTWEWVFGKSPDFEHEVRIKRHRAAGVAAEVRFHVHRGVIDKVTCSAGDVPGALTRIVGARYEAAALCRRLAETAPRHVALELCKILEQEIP